MVIPNGINIYTFKNVNSIVITGTKRINDKDF